MEEPKKELIVFKVSEWELAVAENAPVILDKVTRAEAALSVLDVEIKSAEEDEAVEAMLFKANKTYAFVADLADAIKRPIQEKIIDKINDTLKRIDPKKGSGSIYQKVKLRRDAWLVELSRQNKLKEAGIEKKRTVDLEIARIKTEMKKSLHLGIEKRVANGEEKIAEIFGTITLENIDEAPDYFSFKPLLKEEIFLSFLDVPYNKQLVTVEEYADLKARAAAFFDYKKVNVEYVAEVEPILVKWKSKIPARKIELQQIAKASSEEADQLIKDAADREAREAKERQDNLTAATSEIEKSATIEVNKAALDGEFEAQVQSQGIEAPGQSRKTYRYRFAEEDLIFKYPARMVEIISAAMMHVVLELPSKGENALYLGPCKRSRAGMPERDDQGLVYLEAIDYWLKLLAKVDPRPDIPGLKLEEILTSVATKKKAE